MGIHGDGLKMRRDWGLAMGGEVDLSDAALDRGIGRADHATKWGLAGMRQATMASYKAWLRCKGDNAEKLGTETLQNDDNFQSTPSESWR